MPEPKSIAIAIVTILGGIGTAIVTRQYDLKKQQILLEEQERIRQELQQKSGDLAACSVEKGEANEKIDELQQALDKCSEDLNKCLRPGGHSFILGDRPLEARLGRNDYVLLRMGGRRISVVLDSIDDEDEPIFRLVGCPRPPPVEGLTSDDSRGPSFTLSSTHPEQRLRLSGACCASGRECPSDTLRTLSIVLREASAEDYQALISASFEVE